MHKGVLRIAIVLSAALLNMISAQASDYKGGYIGGKFGINNSSASGAISAPSASTFAYGVQGGYLQGGYNWDVSAATIGVGAYADFNSYEKHENGVEYGSRAYGMDTKLGLPAGDWLPYGKIGYGYSTGTRDLGAVANKSLNYAIGVEYKLVSRLGAIVEYKGDSFSNKDGSVTIRNRTLSFGLNYYFDRPEVAPIIAVSVPELEQLGLPEPELDTDIASEPPPDIGSSIVSSSKIQSDPESWRTLLDNNTVRVEGSRFVTGSAVLESGVVVSGPVMLMPGDVKELKEVVAFAGKYPDSKLELTGYSDNIGSEEFNQMQSLARAESVKKYMVKKGVAADRISTKGEGSANPVGDNNTYEGRAINHRVEIHAVVKEQQKDNAARPAPKSTPKPEVVSAPITASTLKSASEPDSWKALLENKPVHIESTNFVAGTIKLKPRADKELDAVAAFVGKHPEANLEIVGYSDNKSEPALSLELADSVRNYLVTKGVASNRITIKGEGSANPVADNKTKAGRTKNRRVEIHSVAKEQKISGEANPVPMPSLAPAPAPKPVAAPALVAVPSAVAAPVPVSVPAPVAVPETWKLLLEEKPVLVNIEGTSFDSGSGRPNSHVVEELDEVVGFAGKYPDTKLELTGYTDRTGSPELNKKLSFTRAESVKKYLVKKGVSASRITTNGKGPANPVGNDNTKEGRAKNRRVEIHSVIKDEKKARAGVVAPAPVTDQSSGPDKPPP